MAQWDNRYKLINSSTHALDLVYDTFDADSDYIAGTNGETVIFCTGIITVTLPSPVLNPGRMFIVKKDDDGIEESPPVASAVTVKYSGSQWLLEAKYDTVVVIAINYGWTCIGFSDGLSPGASRLGHD